MGLFNNYSFSGKNILVTGAGGGIGKDTVKSLSQKGAHVYATDLSRESMADLEGLANVSVFSLDVRKEESWNSVLSDFQGPGQNKRLDGFIQCAGVLKPGYIVDIDPKDIDFHIDINVKGLILGCTLVSRIMREQKSGHIVNIASLAGLAPIPGISLYSTSKFAVRGFTLAFAQEMKNHNVTVTVICPDAVKTPMLDKQVGYEETALTFSGVQLEPEEVTSAILNSFSNQEMEIILPFYRGVLGKIGNHFPGLSSVLVDILKNKGMKKQEEYK